MALKFSSGDGQNYDDIEAGLHTFTIKNLVDLTARSSDENIRAAVERHPEKEGQTRWVLATETDNGEEVTFNVDGKMSKNEKANSYKILTALGYKVHEFEGLDEDEDIIGKQIRAMISEEPRKDGTKNPDGSPKMFKKLVKEFMPVKAKAKKAEAKVEDDDIEEPSF